MIDMPPPHSIEAEQAVLGGLLLDNAAHDRIAGVIDEDAFFRADHRTIFRHVGRLIGAGQPADVITVFDALTTSGKAEEVGGLPYLNALQQNTPSAANIRHYAETVRDRATLRKLLAATSKIAENAMKPNGRSLPEILESALSMIGDLADVRPTQVPVLAAEAMRAHCDVLEGRLDRKAAQMQTGFRAIDELLNLLPGMLVILGARPSVGKTALALNIAIAVARQKLSVLFLTLEMTSGEILDRALASIGRIPLGKIISGQLDSEDWARFTQANREIEGMRLHIDDQPALTIAEVRAKAKHVKRKAGLDLLVVDYLQLMSGAGDNRNAQIEEISRGLKALAKEQGIVVLALSQLSRRAAGQRPQLSDLRDSGAIEQDADVVMFLHRDEVDNPSTHLRGIADVFVAKNRNGALADQMLRYAGVFTQFSDFDGERPAEPRALPRRGLAKNL